MINPNSVSNPYGNYVTTNYSDRDTTLQFDDRQRALDQMVSEQNKNQLDRVIKEDVIRNQSSDIRTKVGGMSIPLALNGRENVQDPTYLNPNNELNYFKKPHQRPPQDTLIIMTRLLNKILENPHNILKETTKSDDAIYCSGIFLLLSGTSLYLLSNIFS